MEPDPLPTECPECGGALESVTTVPLTYSGACEVLLVCEECPFEFGPIGKDSVL